MSKKVIRIFEGGHEGFSRVVGFKMGKFDEE